MKLSDDPSLNDVPPSTPTKISSRILENSTTALNSPMSKASTPEKGGLHSGFLSEDCTSAPSSISSPSGIVPEESHETAVSDRCVLLKWVEGRKRKLGMSVGRKVARWFGEYDEENPDAWLLLQDLTSLHRREAGDVSVTILTDDDFCDVGFLVGMDSQLELDESNTWAVEESEKAYNEEEPDDYLLGKDLVAVSRRGVHDVEVTFVFDEEEAAQVFMSSLSENTEEYDEDDPEQWLLQQDLISWERRGADMVSVIILWDDEPPVLDHLLWPQGAGCIDLQDHYSHAVDALYPQDGDVDQDDRLQDFLLMKDLITAQRAGAHSVSVTMVTHDQPERTRDFVAAGWEVSQNPFEAPLIMA